MIGLPWTAAASRLLAWCRLRTVPRLLAVLCHTFGLSQIARLSVFAQ